jgi:hypothetical protein
MQADACYRKRLLAIESRKGKELPLEYILGYNMTVYDGNA